MENNNTSPVKIASSLASQSVQGSVTRSIKFRVWNPAKKQWFVPVYEAHAGRLHDVSISLSGEILERTLDYCCDARNNYGLIPVQFTGLKDKNGREIYEGDIVRFIKVKSRDANYTFHGSTSTSNNREAYKGVIRYDDGGYVISDTYAYPFKRPLVNWSNSYHEDGSRLKSLYVHESRIASDHSAEYEDIEVIGNIYENPELLNSEPNPDECDATEAKS